MTSFRWLPFVVALALFSADGRVLAQPLGVNPSAAASDVRNPRSTNPSAAASDHPQPKRHQSICRRVANPSAERPLSKTR
jgi:hypothetical protein